MLDLTSLVERVRRQRVAVPLQEALLVAVSGIDGYLSPQALHFARDNPKADADVVLINAPRLEQASQ